VWESDRPARHARVVAGLAAACAAVVSIFACWLGGVLDPSRPLRFGHDFITPYTVGRMVLAGDGGRLYEASATEAAGRRVIAEANLVGDSRHVRLLNPGWFAAPFVPLALLPYRYALIVWAAAGAALFAGTLATLLRWLPKNPRLRAAFAMATVVSCPFLLAFQHQQNTFLSLTLVVGVATAWRAGTPSGLFRAGLLAGLLAYKPQLAAGLGLVLAVAGGRRAVAGLAVGGLAMGVLGEVVAPGSTVGFVRALPDGVAAFQVEATYNWGRQVTPTAFWRSAANRWFGLPAGQAAEWARYLGTATSAIALVVLVASAWAARAGRWHAEAGGRLASCRGPANGPDIGRGYPGPLDLTALTVLALPLLAPYFMDYDLLLLAVPAAHALGASRRRATTRSAVGWALLWAATAANVDAVATFGLNVAPVVVGVLFAATASRMLAAGPSERERLPLGTQVVA
jgi:hypothetical protein